MGAMRAALGTGACGMQPSRNARQCSPAHAQRNALRCCTPARTCVGLVGGGGQVLLVQRLQGLVLRVVAPCLRLHLVRKRFDLLLDRACAYRGSSGAQARRRERGVNGGPEAAPAGTAAAALPNRDHRGPPAPSHHAPFMSMRVTVMGLSWPMRWLRPMACRVNDGFSVGSHRMMWVPAVSVTPAPPALHGWVVPDGWRVSAGQGEDRQRGR